MNEVNKLFRDLDFHINWCDDESLIATTEMIDCLFVYGDYLILKKKYNVKLTEKEENILNNYLKELEKDND